MLLFHVSKSKIKGWQVFLHCKYFYWQKYNFSLYPNFQGILSQQFGILSLSKCSGSTLQTRVSVQQVNQLVTNFTANPLLVMKTGFPCVHILTRKKSFFISDPVLIARISLFTPSSTLYRIAVQFTALLLHCKYVMWNFGHRE